MGFKLRVGPDVTKRDDEGDEPKNGWVAMWQTFGWMVFILACLAYCSRNQIVEIMK